MDEDDQNNEPDLMKDTTDESAEDLQQSLADGDDEGDEDES